MRSKKHKDVEFQVEGHGGRDFGYYKTFADAAVAVLNAGMATGYARLSVLVSSRAGARWVGGDDAVASYNEDPDASAHASYEFRVNAQGRIA